MGTVLLLGGSPMAGKSTVAKALCKRLQINSISTDDIGEALQTVADINPMQSKFYLDYYAQTDVNTLISDIQVYHRKIEPAIHKLTQLHTSWRDSTIIEGWAIYPEFANQFSPSCVKAIWLIACPTLLKHRILKNSAFCNTHPSSTQAVQHYLQRSMWHTAFLKQQCEKYKYPFITLTGKETAEELAVTILEQSKYIP